MKKLIFMLIVCGVSVVALSAQDLGEAIRGNFDVERYWENEARIWQAKADYWEYQEALGLVDFSHEAKVWTAKEAFWDAQSQQRYDEYVTYLGDYWTAKAAYWEAQASS